jgi:hypothetical protein
MDLRPGLVLLVLLLAGCIGGGSDDGVAPTTSMAHPAAPLLVYKKEIDACPPNGKDPQAQTTATTGKFEVKPGYDELIIAFHESGSGTGISAEIRWVEEGNALTWSKPQHNTAVPPVACGAHSHTGDGDTKKVEPGNYTVRLNYSGAVSLHLEVTARSTMASQMPANHTHMAI